jgi:regulator of sigma E protease
MNLSTFFTHLPEYIWYGVVFLVLIAILVAAHELGHYLFARLFGMGVEEFSIGFGKKPIWTWGKRSYDIPLPAGDTTPLGHTMIESGGSSLEGGVAMRDVEVRETPSGRVMRETTVFTFRPWPLGGFVRIKGMLPQDDGSETQVPGGLYSKPVWQRFLVLLAGPAFSIIAGVLLLLSVYMAEGIRDVDAPVIGSMAKDEPGYKAGLRPDDRVISIDGTAIVHFYDLIKIVRVSDGKPLQFAVEREGKPMTFTVTPKAGPVPSPVLGPDMMPTGETKIQARIGVIPAAPRRLLSFGEAFSEAVQTPGRAVEGLTKIFRHPQTFSDQVGGPASMVVYTAQAVQSGFSQVVLMAGFLSISLGIMNLLPVFPLDGGQMAVAVAEMLRGGRRLSIGVQNAIGTAGFAFVILLYISVVFIDIHRFFPGTKPGTEKKIEMAVGKQN